MAALYALKPIDMNVYPDEHDEGTSQSWWEFRCVKVPDIGDVYQIAETAIVSFCVHSDPGHVLVSRSLDLTYAVTQEICNLLAFVLDTPCECGSLGRTGGARATQLAPRRLDKLYEKLGHNVGWVDVDSLRVEAAEAVVGLWDGFDRTLPLNSADGYAITSTLPTDEKLRDALVAYRQGISAIDPVGAILNFCRVIERFAGLDKTATAAALHDLWGKRLYPVLISARGTQRRNLVPIWKEIAKPHYLRLLRKHGTAEGIMQDFKGNRRNPAAHGRQPLAAESEDGYLDLLYDAILLKLLARCVIQDHIESLDSL